MVTDKLRKAAAAAAAYRARGLTPTRRGCLTLCAIAAGPESCIGDAADLPGNWGGTQKRACSVQEKSLIASGGVPLPTSDDEQLHGDSDPVSGHYAVWFWRAMNADGTPDDVTAAGRMLTDLVDVRKIDPGKFGDGHSLASAMYAAHYFAGFHTDAASNVRDYATAIDKAYKEWDLAPELTGWSPDPRVCFPLVPGEFAGDRLARIMRHFAGVSLSSRRSELEALAGYVETDPVNEAARGTNCGTSERWFLAVAGCPHPLARCPYVSGMAVSWDDTIARDSGAMVTGADAWKQVGPGWMLHYGTPGKNDDHEEMDLSKVAIATTAASAIGVAEHGGGGRANNAITTGTGDIRRSLGRPLRCVTNPDKLGIPVLPAIVSYDTNPDKLGIPVLPAIVSYDTNPPPLLVAPIPAPIVKPDTRYVPFTPLGAATKPETANPLAVVLALVVLLAGVFAPMFQACGAAH